MLFFFPSSNLIGLFAFRRSRFSIPCKESIIPSTLATFEKNLPSQFIYEDTGRSFLKEHVKSDFFFISVYNPFYV